ncbi:MAG: hypothetical protein KatS3mg105_2057 [Gemmatales bacterium]|nr:MAG: hypothetical protein KatS3mg105_2057 [Gemmatales bacterium]
MPAFQPNKVQLLCDLTFEGAWPTTVAFLGSSRRLAAGNRDGQLFIWELPDKQTKEPPPPVRFLQGHTNGITRLRATRDGKTLVSSSLDRSVRLWDTTAPTTGSTEVVLDMKTREQEARRQRKPEIVTKPGVKVATQTAAHVFQVHQNWVQALDLSGDEKRLITGDDNGMTIVWDLASRKEIARWTGYPGNWITSAALTSDGQTAFVAEFCSRRGDFDRPPAQARIYDASTGKEKLDILKVQFPNVKKRDNSYGYATTWGKFVARGFVAADFSPDDNILAVGQGGETGTGKVHLLDSRTGKLIRSVSGHQYGVTDVQFSADGQFVLSAGRDTSIRICRVSDGKEIAKLGKERGGQFKDWFHAVDVSPDQQCVAAADIAGQVRVWRLG